MPCACLEWRGEAWNGVSAEASPRGTQPSSLFILSPEWCPGRRMSDREKIIRSSRAFNSPGGSGRGHFLFRGGGGVCYYFPFIEEKIEACKCLMWGLMCTEKEREVHLYSSSTDGPCRSDVLSPSAGRPVWSCLCMCPRYSWHQPTVAWHSPNVELPRLKQRAIFYTLVPLLFLCCRHTDH